MANSKTILMSLFALVLILFLILTSIVSAESVTFIKEYTYMASDIDSKVSSRAIALEQVKRALLEQLGTYLISETEVKNFQMTKDQITTLTAGIVSAEIIEEKWDGRSYYLKAKIASDPKQVAESVDALRTDKAKSRELEESRKKAEDAMKEVTRLKKELELVKADTKHQKDYSKAINELSAADWFDKGYALVKFRNWQGAIDAFSKVIELNPDYAMAYNNRGNAYSDLGNYEHAIKDLSKAIELNLKYAEAYYNRGNAHAESGNKQQAIKDYDKAIELEPQLWQAYYNRGYAYYYLKNTHQALKDFDKTIKLNPENADAYNNRGSVYSDLGNNQRAIKDYDKAIELNPDYALAYYNRGFAYYDLGNKQAAVQNMKKAATLGHKKAQNILRSDGIQW